MLRDGLCSDGWHYSTLADRVAARQKLGRIIGYVQQDRQFSDEEWDRVWADYRAICDGLSNARITLTGSVAGDAQLWKCQRETGDAFYPDDPVRCNGFWGGDVCDSTGAPMRFWHPSQCCPDDYEYCFIGHYSKEVPNAVP